jgi:hypothetical protein
MTDKPYSERIGEAQRLVNKCYKYAPSDPFRICVKTPCTPEQAYNYLTMETNQENYPLVYPIDGLILVSENAPYQCGKDDGLFKYKKLEDHTVDFQAKVWTRDRNGTDWHCDLFIMDGGKRKCVQTTPLLPGFLEKLNIDSPALLDNSILECVWSKHLRLWEPRKQRFDKQMPNNQNTLNLTLQNITENISIVDLLSLFEKQ